MSDFSATYPKMGTFYSYYPPSFDRVLNSEQWSYDEKYIVRSPLVKNQKDALGWRSPSPYTCQAFESEGWNGTIEIERYIVGVTGLNRKNAWEGALSSYFGGIPGPKALDTGLPGSNDRYRAEVECLLKVRRQSINLLNVFAERQKTIDLIAERSLRLFNGFRLAKRGKFRDAARALGIGKVKGKQNARTWLELQYGWLPLMSDIHGGYEALTKQTRRNGMLFNVNRTISSDDSRVETIALNPSATKVYNFQVQRKTKVSLWYTVEYEQLLEASSVGLLNPLEVAWELTPWSFVVDWFLPVGNLLGALSATSGVTFKGGTLTRSTRSVLTAQYLFFDTVEDDYYDFRRSANVKGGWNYFGMDRMVYSGSPVPTPYVKNPLSVKHGLNALALIRGLFK